MKLKALSVFMSAVLVLSFVPSAALAETLTQGDSEQQAVQQSDSEVDGVSGGSSSGPVDPDQGGNVDEGTVDGAASGNAADGVGDLTSTESTEKASDGETVSSQDFVDQNASEADSQEGSSAEEPQVEMLEGVTGDAVASGDYFIVSAGASTLFVGSNLTLQDRKVNDAQTWTVSYDANSKTATICNASTHEYLAVSGKKLVSVSSASDSATWALKAAGSSFVLTNSKTGLCLDVKSASFKSGSSVQAYKPNDTKAQQWSLVSEDDLRESMDSSAAANMGTVPQDEMLYIMNSLGTNVSLDVKSGSTANKANVQLYSSNKSSAQQWKVSYDSQGYATITNVGSGKVLDVASSLALAGSNVQQYEPNGTLAQKWIIKKDSNGAYTIESALWSGLVLDVANGSSANGSNVQLGTKGNGKKSQAWKIATESDIRSQMDQRALESGRQLDNNGVYVIKSALSNTAVADVKSGSTANGANVQIYASNMTDAQMWRVSYDGNNYATFTNVGSGKVLDVKSAHVANKTNVQQYASNGSYAQKWIIEDNGDGTLTIASALWPDVVLDVASGSSKNGANIQVYSSNETKAQKWTFLSADPSVPPCDDLGISGKWFEVSPKGGTSYAIDVASGSSSNGANIQIYKKNNTLAQLFRFDFVKTSGGKGYYQIVNAQSGKALDVTDGNLVPSTNVQQWTAGTSSGNQLFAAVKNSDGSYTFINEATGLALDVKDGTIANKSNVQVYTDNGTAAQKFVLSERTNLLNEGIFKITSALSTSKVVDVKSGSTSNGANVQLYGWNDTFAQKWEVKRVGDNAYTIQSTASGKYLAADANGNVCQRSAASDGSQYWIPSISSGFYVLKNQKSGKVLDVASASTANGANVQVYSANGTNAQRFSFKTVSTVAKGTYHLRSAANSSYVVDVKSGSKSNSANVQLYKANNTGAQKWDMTENSDGSYTIVNSASGKALDVKSAGTANGTNVQQYTKNGSNAQKWNVVYNSDGTFRLVSKLKSDLVLTVSGSAKNGANVMVSKYTGSSLQKFTFEKTTYTPPIPSAQQKMLNKINGYSSKTSYLIAVNLSTHKVGVFTGSKGNWKVKYYWDCVTGASGSPTITGSYYTTGFKRTALTTDSRAKWATQINGGYFFHTILASNSELGKSLSHGCVRLATSNAKWIYNNIKAGTRVVLYR